MFVNKIKNILTNLKSKKLGVLGLSFKPNTDDMREAPSIDIINDLLDSGAKIYVFDPVAMDKAKEIFGERVNYCNNLYKTAENSDALIILTDWVEFKKIDFKNIGKLLKRKIIIDGRNMFDPSQMVKLGFKYYSVGRKKYEK